MEVDLKPFQSVLESHPEHVQAIGMIQIETTNLEHALGTMLAAFLDLPEDVGQIIYLTPKTTIGRLEILKNLIEHMLDDKSDGRKRLESISARAQKIFGKRHAIVHGTWGKTSDVISYISGPPSDKNKPINCSTDNINTIISDIRILVSDVANEIHALRKSHYANLLQGSASPMSQSQQWLSSRSNRP